MWFGNKWLIHDNQTTLNLEEKRGTMPPSTGLDKDWLVT